MASIYIHNLTQSTVYYLGVPIDAASSYLIPTSKYVGYVDNETLLTDILSGDAGISNDNTNYYTGAAGINILKGILPTDEDNALLSRPKLAPSGWTFQARAVEFATSTLSSLVNNKIDGTSWNDVTIKFYDDEDTELTDQNDLDTDCVKTILSWEPLYDYEIVGGFLSSKSNITDNCRIYMIGVPDLAAEYGGSKVMVNGINLAHIDGNDRLTIDGRTSKRLNYNATYHTNKLQVTIFHGAGSKYDLQIVFEHYKL